MLHIEEPTLAELLNEPIVLKLMARDRVSVRQVCAIAVAARYRIENSSTQTLRASSTHIPASLRTLPIESSCIKRAS
jgi:hypothetical protein